VALLAGRGRAPASPQRGARAARGGGRARRLALEDGEDGLEAGDGGLRDAKDVEALLVRGTEVGGALDVDVEVECASGGIVVCYELDKGVRAYQS
jgi:hypothetical protein